MNLQKEAAALKGIEPEKLSQADAFETWLVGLPKKQYEYISEMLQGVDKDSNGMNDAEWVADWDREVAIERMQNNRQ